MSVVSAQQYTLYWCLSNVIHISCVSARPTDQFKHKAEFMLQKGRCLNVGPDFSAEAEECLSRAVKLEPSLVEGWNTLGEQYWKKGDLIGAKNCFTGALQQVQ